MKLASFEAIVRALNEAGVRYLIAGGLAVNAHGYLRFTQDVDVVLTLEPDNILSAFEALARLGYRSIVPVTADEFADPLTRTHWITEKGMTVLGFFSDVHRETPVDVFVQVPFDFQMEYENALQGEVLPGLHTRFVSIDTLIKMKEAADRPRDRDDIQHLRWIVEDENRDA
jgi:hypothetical protein